MLALISPRHHAYHRKPASLKTSAIAAHCVTRNVALSRHGNAAVAAYPDQRVADEHDSTRMLVGTIARSGPRLEEEHPMTVSRRDLLTGAAATLALAGIPAPGLTRPRVRLAATDSTDPWLEIDAAALAHNVHAIATMAGGRPILAVVKNNAYGLGLDTAGPILAAQEAVWGLGVVRGAEALALRAAGVRKPVLLMGPASDDEALSLARDDVRLAPFDEADRDRLIRLAARLGRPVTVHLYVDTGMHRMGMPHDRGLPWLDSPELRGAIRIEGAFTELTEDQEFDREQAARLRRLAEAARTRGLNLGLLHAASSHAIVKPTVETFLDLVRPGLALYGGYPSAESWARGGLRPAYRLKARVIRLDHVEPGEGVSYHRRYTATEPTRIATLAIGHVDGYPAGAVRGCEVLIRDQLYPVIGTVSASHTVAALGPDAPVAVGDEVTLVGPDAPALHPNEVARRSGWSEYNMFMHLNPALQRRAAERLGG
jgi:alanine racemase